MTTQVYEEAEYRMVADPDHRALVLGGGSVAEAVIIELTRRGVRCATVDDGSINKQSLLSSIEAHTGQLHFVKAPSEPQALVELASTTLDGLTLLVHVCMPDPAHRPANALDACQKILERSLAAADYMSAHGGGAIVNHCALPVMYAGGELEDYMSSLRGAITGVIRTIARKYGRQNVRSVGVQTGLLDIPETHAWATPEVKVVDVPTKRWGTATECARLIAFSGLDASYITGQILILDGGLTAGLSGT